jgi:hypothetical protein
MWDSEDSLQRGPHILYIYKSEGSDLWIKTEHGTLWMRIQSLIMRQNVQVFHTDWNLKYKLLDFW